MYVHSIRERAHPIALWFNRKRCELLLLLNVQCVLAEAGAVLFELQLFATGLAAEDVIDVARFFANQEHHFGFFLAFGHC